MDWQSQINPLTGHPFESQEDYDQFARSYGQETEPGQATDPYQPGGQTPTEPSQGGDWFGSNGPTANQGGGNGLASWWDPTDAQGSFMRLVAGKPANSQTLASLKPYLEAIGGRLENPNAAGITSKIILPGGQIIRVGNFFDGGGTPSWGWTDQAGGGSGGGTPIPSPEGYTTAPRPAGLDTPYTPPQFTAPSLEDLLASPGYRAGMDTTQKGFERSAAARGTLLSGGSALGLGKALNDYASTKYGDLYNQRLGAFGANAGLTQAARGINENAYQSDVTNNLNQYLQRYGAYRNLVGDQQFLAKLGLDATQAGTPGGAS